MINKNISVSVIISVYKDVESLKLILKSLSTQTYDNFEIIISEDGESSIMKEFINSYTDLELIHSYHKDEGWRKNIALNNAIKKSNGEYLIFIDGDIIPYSNFVEMHLHLSDSKKVLCGKRVELGSYMSKLIRNYTLSTSLLEKLFIPLLPLFALDKARHIEEGIKLSPLNYIAKRRNSKENLILIGCNFSCYKKDLELINGFDEDYSVPSVGEDVDLIWRFRHFNIKLQYIRNVANVFHLWHKRTWNMSEVDFNNKILDKKRYNKEFKCINGLKKEIK